MISMDRSAMACSLTIHLTVDNTQLWIQGEVIPNKLQLVLFSTEYFMLEKNMDLCYAVNHDATCKHYQKTRL